MRRAVRIDADADGADVREGEVHQGPLERRPRQDPEGVALRDAAREEAVRQELDAFRGLGPRDLAPRLALVDEVRRAGVPRHGVAPQPKSSGRRAFLMQTVLRSTALSGRVARRRPSIAYQDRPPLDWEEHARHLERITQLRSREHPRGPAPATKPAARQSDLSFRMLHRKCLTPIKQALVPDPRPGARTGRDRQGVGGREGQFVIVEEAELEALERHDDSRTIDIERFVPLDDVDPIWMDRTCAFLVPGAAPAQRRPYKHNLEAMEESSVGAIGRLVRSGRESLCLVRPRGRGARARDAPRRGRLPGAEIDEAMEETDTKAQELDLARQIVEGLQADFDPSELTSGYQRDLRELLEAKLKGEPIVVPEPEAEPAPTVGLIEALKASVAAAKTSSPARKAAADKPGPTASRLGSRLRRSARTGDEWARHGRPTRTA